MITLKLQEIRGALEERRQRDRERMRREKEAMDAFAVKAVQSFTEGLRGVAEGPDPADANGEES